MKESVKGRDGAARQGARDSLRVDVPPGGVKIMDALRLLLQEKNFDSITTAEISRVAGANEALIYRYFKDKRGLLHQVLAEYFLDHFFSILQQVESVEGAINKLTSLIKGTMVFHKQNRVFSKILLLEVRNNPGFFESDAYRLVKQYARLIKDILEQGVRNREIRDDLPIACLRDVILGSIEHVCLRSVVFNRDFDEELLASNLAKAMIGGLGNYGARELATDDGEHGGQVEM